MHRLSHPVRMYNSNRQDKVPNILNLFTRSCQGIYPFRQELPERSMDLLCSFSSGYKQIGPLLHRRPNTLCNRRRSRCVVEGTDHLDRPFPLSALKQFNAWKVFQHFFRYEFVENTVFGPSR